MDKFNCHRFELEFRVLREVFQKEAFLNDIKDVTPEVLDFCAWTFGSKTEPDKQHADIRIDFRQKKHIGVRIVYHRTDLKTDDRRPPYMEECATWLGSFIDDVHVSAELDVLYYFEKDYSPVVSLPFPLLSAAQHGELEGAFVTGIAIQLPNQQGLERVTIDREDNRIYLSLAAKREIKLKQFRLEETLEELSSIVNILITKEGRQI